MTESRQAAELLAEPERLCSCLFVPSFSDGKLEVKEVKGQIDLLHTASEAEHNLLEYSKKKR